MCFCELRINFSSLVCICKILTLQKQFTLFFVSCFLVVEKFFCQFMSSEKNYEYWEMTLLAIFMYTQMKTKKYFEQETLYETLIVPL